LAASFIREARSQPRSGALRRVLGLAIRHDPATELVTKIIIKLAQQGVRDADTLLTTTLKEFNSGG
jgi:hypothetical protein